MSETQMVAKQEQSKMVAPEAKKSTTAKVYALREFMVGERVVKPGEVVEVEKKYARDLIKKIKGGYAFSGERFEKDGDILHHDLTRARLATAADLVEHKPLTPIDEDELLKD